MKENTNGESSLASNCHFFHVTFLFNLELKDSTSDESKMGWS